MSLSRNRLYTLLFLACIAGYIWTFINMQDTHAGHLSAEVCLFKNVTNIPCPSCGTSRAVVALLHGHYSDAFYMNPIGFIVASIMLLAPIWIIADLLRRSSSLYSCYRQAELALRKPQYAIPMVTLVLVNWMWNINKGL